MIYMIQEIGFDNMENHYPEVHECIGYCDTEEEAGMCVEKLNSGKKYKGWDNNYYPKYAIIPLKKIDLEVQKSDSK